MSIVHPFEKLAARLYPRRLAIALWCTGISFIIFFLAKQVVRLGLSPGGFHILRYVAPVLVWGWCIFLLCEWFDPRRGVFSSPRGVEDETFSKELSILRPVFLGILLLLFCSPLALWLVILL
jgi:hypothetical protein